MSGVSSFRDHAAAGEGVRELYRLNHERQTLDFVLAKKREYLPPRRARMSVWESVERLGEIFDESDPDLELSQLDHALQVAEALRADGQPRWLVLTGFVHDLGKVLMLFGEPAWAVVGDTFPVGCAFAPELVHSGFFEANPDARVPERSTPTGIYEAGCGLDRLHLSWGHDEYLYRVLEDHLPEEALWIIRYHSFYAAHRDGAYAHLLAPGDRRVLDAVRRFQPYDLYTKAPLRPDWRALRPFYEDLVAELLPPELDW